MNIHLKAALITIGVVAVVCFMALSIYLWDFWAGIAWLSLFGIAFLYFIVWVNLKYPAPNIERAFRG